MTERQYLKSLSYDYPDMKPERSENGWILFDLYEVTKRDGVFHLTELVTEFDNTDTRISRYRRINRCHVVHHGDFDRFEAAVEASCDVEAVHNREHMNTTEWRSRGIRRHESNHEKVTA